MIQVDGLSQTQLEKALANNKLPFLRKLIAREDYCLNSFYSGLPSTTPAVQAELFYGVKCAVPAFAFRDHESRQMVRMFEPATAAKVTARYISNDAEALLSGGSAYTDIYDGGAAEPHYCASSMGWGPALRNANPLVLFAFVISNLYSFLRVAVLLLIELGLGLFDFVRGLADGRDFVEELKFVLKRVAITILLRELCVIGGKIDLSRGLPIIHINLLGYDEQAHLRGPHSLFAHWSLKGIDDAIARLWRAANNSAWRHYDVWIYSDHGQSFVRPYHKVQGYDLEEAVKAAFKQPGSNPTAGNRKSQDSIQTQRLRFLGGRYIQSLFPVLGETDEGQPRVAGLGPVAHVYSPEEMSSDQRDSIAHELVHKHKIPIVLYVETQGSLCARTGAGKFHLPQDIATLFGSQHPFLDSIGDDLLRLCEHPDAGDLVLLGWCAGVSPMSFTEQNGAHAGASPEETNGFTLLPADTTLPKRKQKYMRPGDLRHAALHHLGRSSHRTFAERAGAVATTTDTLRVMTYNVHSCAGMDGKLSPQRIARLIARDNPDVVALQELDVGRARSKGMDQAKMIAHYLMMDFHFHAAIHVEDERYGDAILTHLPQRLVKAGLLPRVSNNPRRESRGALWVAVDLNGKEIQIFNTHLGLSSKERKAQVEALLGSDWLANEKCREPFILCGDFNSLPSSMVYRRLSQRLRDVQTESQDQRPQSTFFGRFPTLRLDHIFISSGLEVISTKVIDSQMARLASDHLPLITDIRIKHKR
jgi:endonuclease/exonuclease/phosphatase family metal-dependent hydrolase